MKGSKLSRNIRYDTIYKYLNIPDEPTVEIRKKKAAVRKAVKEMLDYWKKSNWISEYEENKENTTIATVSIILIKG